MVPIRLSWHWIATNLQFVKKKKKKERKEKAKSAKHNKVRHSKMKKKKKKEAQYFPHHSQENIPKNNPFVWFEKSNLQDPNSRNSYLLKTEQFGDQIHPL